jgi:hypothetical protein
LVYPCGERRDEEAEIYSLAEKYLLGQEEKAKKRAKGLCRWPGWGRRWVLYAEVAVFADVAARGIAGGRRNIGARYFCALASGVWAASAG